MGGRDVLRLAGEALYGKQWQTPLSRDLGVSDRTIRYWAAGHGCPTDIHRRLLPILRQRGESVLNLVSTLENSRNGTA